MIEMRVRVENEETLVYTFRTVSEASEIMLFLSDFWPRAEYVIQPLRH